MRVKKVRGHKRLQKRIDRWRNDNLSIDLINYITEARERYYAKIRVHPWSGISRQNSTIQQPSGETRQKMLAGLLDIYENWKKQLDGYGKPYYLKIWLFEPRFSKSQVVCAAGKEIHFYDTTFFRPEQNKIINSKNYGQLKERLKRLKWDYCLDEDGYDNGELGSPEIYASISDYEETKKGFENLLKRPHRTSNLDKPMDDITELYFFKRGAVWIGGEK